MQIISHFLPQIQFKLQKKLTIIIITTHFKRVLSCLKHLKRLASLSQIFVEYSEFSLPFAKLNKTKSEYGMYLFIIHRSSVDTNKRKTKMKISEWFNPKLPVSSQHTVKTRANYYTHLYLHFIPTQVLYYEYSDNSRNSLHRI